jgi:hypothetical protein
MAEIRTPPKRLVDLNPKWLDGEAAHAAIEFDCPCGQKCSFTRVYLPITGRSKHSVTWELTGSDDFATLTLSPSIHAVGHWHGFLRNGVLESC